MEKIAWITDSTSLIDEKLARDNNIHVVPLNVMFGEQSYREGIDMNPDQFYEKMKSCCEMPTTSQPAIGDFVRLYERLKQDYTRGIAVHLSDAHSGTCATSATAAGITDFPVEVINSKITLQPMAQLVIAGKQLQDAGKTFTEIVDGVRELSNKIKMYFVVDDLSHLQRGGRLSMTQFLMGSLLSIKPILTVVEGKITPFEKIRTLRKAKDRIMEKLEADLRAGLATHVNIFHADNEQGAVSWKEELISRFPHILPQIHLVSPIVGVHTGPGTLGLSWFKL